MAGGQATPWYPTQIFYDIKMGQERRALTLWTGRVKSRPTSEEL